MEELSNKILASQTLSEAYDVLMNAIGSQAWKHLEDLMTAQKVKESDADWKSYCERNPHLINNVYLT